MSVQVAEVEDLLSALVRIDSVTPSLISNGAGEGVVAAFLRDWLAGIGPDLDVTL